MSAKKLVLLALVVFVGFWMFTDPQGLAQTAQDGGGELWSLTQQLFEAVIRFLGVLF